MLHVPLMPQGVNSRIVNIMSNSIFSYMIVLKFLYKKDHCVYDPRIGPLVMDNMRIDVVSDLEQRNQEVP